MSQLIDTYKSVLSAVGLSTKDDGSIFNDDGDRHFIKGKPVYLPLNSVLSDSSVVDKLIFHPLGEAAAKGESDVLEDLRLRGVRRLSLQLSKMFAFFTALGVGEVKASLDPEQLKVMQVIKDVSEKEARDIMSLIRATGRGEGKKTPLIKIFLSRSNGTQNGKKYSRKAVVVFPLYTAVKTAMESKDKTVTVLGVPLNRKALTSFVKLMEFIFPSIAEDGAYNEGGFSQVAPFCDALFRAVGNLTALLNEKSNMFESIDEICPKALPEGWADAVDVMDSLFAEISMIPVQPNADGKARVSDIQQASLAMQPAAAAVPVQQAGQPVQVAVPQAPMQQQVYQQPHVQHAAPAAPAPQPQFIMENGMIKKNPAYGQQFVAGVGMTGMPMQQGPSHDPFMNQPYLPSTSGQMTHSQMLMTAPGGVVAAQPPMQMQPQMPMGYPQQMGYQQPGMVGYPQLQQPGMMGYGVPQQMGYGTPAHYGNR